MSTLTIKSTIGNSMRSFSINMKYLTVLLFFILLSCNSKESETKKEIVSQEIQHSVVSSTENTSPPVVHENSIEDLTEEIYLRIKDSFSGSWMKDHDVVDGEREMSWGTVPFSNRFYFIIDFQNDNRILIKGASEGGKKGFDRYIGKVLRIEEEEINVYRFTYKNTISTRNPNRKYEVILRYNPENDTLAIVGNSNTVYDNPSEMIRSSDPIFP